MRATVLFGLLAMLGWAAMAGPLQIGPQSAVADETGGEISTPEEPPVSEPPAEPETPPKQTETPPVETPVTSPPAETPTAGEGLTPQAEAPKGGGGGTSTSPAATPTGSGGSGGGDGGSGPGAGSGSTGTATVSPAGTTTTTTHHASHGSRPSRSGGGGGGGSKAGAKSGGGNAGGGGGGNAGAKAGGGGDDVSHSAGPAPIPAVSPEAIDEGATAVSHVAAHVGEVFSEALPTAPLEKLGTRIAAHAGLIPHHKGKAQADAVQRIGTALGAALIGSAVAVEKPAPSHSPVSFLDPASSNSGIVFVIGIAGLLLIAALLIAREVRVSLGSGGDGGHGSAARTAIGARAAASWARLAAFGERGSLRFRQLRADAAAGLRSLF